MAIKKIDKLIKDLVIREEELKQIKKRYDTDHKLLEYLKSRESQVKVFDFYKWCEKNYGMLYEEMYQELKISGMFDTSHCTQITIDITKERIAKEYKKITD
jgi:hypothetical protein